MVMPENDVAFESAVVAADWEWAEFDDERRDASYAAVAAAV